MDDSVTGNKSATPENDSNESFEQHINQNSLAEYEVIGSRDTSLKLDSRMSDVLELDYTAHLEQAIGKTNKNGGLMEKQFYQIRSTSSSLSFDKNISEIHKASEKLDKSSRYSTTSDKTPNVSAQAALLEIERLRHEFNQRIFELRQKFMSKNGAKMSNGMNDFRPVSDTTYWSGDKSSSKTGVGSFIEESEIRQLAECRDIIENTPLLNGALAGKRKQTLCENRAKRQYLSDNAAASMEHCNDYAKTRDKQEGGNESSKKTAQNLDVTLKKQETEKQSEGHHIESLQILAQKRKRSHDRALIATTKTVRISPTTYDLMATVSEYIKEKTVAYRDISNDDFKNIKQFLSPEAKQLFGKMPPSKLRYAFERACNTHDEFGNIAKQGMMKRKDCLTLPSMLDEDGNIVNNDVSICNDKGDDLLLNQSRAQTGVRNRKRSRKGLDDYKILQLRLKIAIDGQKAEQEGFKVPPEVADLINECITSGQQRRAANCPNGQTVIEGHFGFDASLSIRGDVWANADELNRSFSDDNGTVNQHEVNQEENSVQNTNVSATTEVLPTIEQVSIPTSSGAKNGSGESTAATRDIQPKATGDTLFKKPKVSWKRPDDV